VCTICTDVPVERTIAALPSCAASLASGGSVHTSSMSPAMKSSDTPAKIPTSCVLACSGPSVASQIPAARPT